MFGRKTDKDRWSDPNLLIYMWEKYDVDQLLSVKSSALVGCQPHAVLCLQEVSAAEPERRQPAGGFYCFSWWLLYFFSFFLLHYISLQNVFFISKLLKLASVKLAIQNVILQSFTLIMLYLCLIFNKQGKTNILQILCFS